MTVVRYVLVKVRPGVSLDEFEKFEREVDYVKAAQNPSIVSYRTHRIEDLDPGIEGGPWDCMERIEGAKITAPRSIQFFYQSIEVFYDLARRERLPQNGAVVSARPCL
jgi:hypothetical protein